MRRKEYLFTIFALIPLFVVSQVDFNNNNILQNSLGSAIGQNHTINGYASFTMGTNSIANGTFSTAMGFYAESLADDGFALGGRVRNAGGGSFTIGRGYLATGQYLINGIQNTLIIGFNSTAPTLFISESPSDDDNPDRTGKVAIGNVPNMEPQAKLHIYSDDGEEASLLIEPNNWAAGEHAKLILGESSHYIKAENNSGVEFSSQNDFIFSGNNSGFGVTEPKAKVHINGDLLFEESMNGIIMKSEDGNCWKGTITNSGELEFSQIDCGTLTSVQNNIQEKHSEVFIYPNPTNGELTIEYTGNRKNLRVEFYTIHGLLVATRKIIKGENKIILKDISSQTIVASVYTKKGELLSTNKILINK